MFGFFCFREPHVLKFLNGTSGSDAKTFQHSVQEFANAWSVCNWKHSTPYALSAYNQCVTTTHKGSQTGKSEIHVQALSGLNMNNRRSNLRKKHKIKPFQGLGIR